MWYSGLTCFYLFFFQLVGLGVALWREERPASGHWQQQQQPQQRSRRRFDMGLHWDAHMGLYYMSCLTTFYYASPLAAEGPMGQPRVGTIVLRRVCVTLHVGKILLRCRLFVSFVSFVSCLGRDSLLSLIGSPTRNPKG